MTCPHPDDIPLFQLPMHHHLRGVGIIEIVSENVKTQLPLKAVAIDASVAGRVARVEVRQTFINKRQEHLEATYIFPLTPGCAVSQFELLVGDRTIVGRVVEREAGRAEYKQALESGHRAALLEQERDDVFTVKVGNLPPGDEVTVVLVYAERLPYFANGTTELHLPLVVAPRYVPGDALDDGLSGDGTAAGTDVVPDASRISPPLLAHGFDPKIGLSITVHLQGGDTWTNIECSQHATKMTSAPDCLTVCLASNNERLNRDFILRWCIGQEKLKTALLVHKTADGENYGMLTILPPRRAGYASAPRDVLFLVDRSGSMGGEKMVSAARACSILLSTLGPEDRFAIMAFDDEQEWLLPTGRSSAGDLFVNADEAELARAHKFLHDLNARGGTEMFLAMHAGLQAIAKRSGELDGRIPVIVAMTDGEVGDESRINRLVQTKLGDARLFAVGIDTAANRGLLTRMTNLGGGTAAFVVPGSQLEEALASVGREIGTPLVVDLQIEKDGRVVPPASIGGQELGDLFEGRAVTTYLKITDKSALTVTGRYPDGSPFSQRVKPVFVEMPAIAQLWARACVQDLEDQFRLALSDHRRLQKKIVDLCCKYTILSRFTAFIVVDKQKPTGVIEGLHRCVQPVEQPHGWAATGQFMAQHVRGVFGNLLGGASPPQSSDWGAQQQPGPCAYSQSPAPGVKFMRLQQPAPLSGCDGLASSARCKVQSETTDDFGWGVLPASGGGTDEVLRALVHLAELIEANYALVVAGQLPPVEPFEQARVALVQLLLLCPVGTRVPLLQKFLRGAAVELAASLRSESVLAAGVKPLWERHRETFLEAQEQATTQLASNSCGTGRKSGFSLF